MGYYQSKRYEPPENLHLKDLKGFDPRQMEINQMVYLDDLKFWRVSTLMYQLIVPVSLEVLITEERLNGYMYFFIYGRTVNTQKKLVSHRFSKW